ncbi:MAG: hypothetical protein ABIL20_07840 [candidate division WOR-3 bacterium]
MKKKIIPLCIYIFFLIFTTCGKKVMIPPRINLKEHEIVGMIQFKCSNEGKLASLATRRFKQAIREDQGTVRIVDLGTEKEVLRKIGRNKLDKESFQLIGEKYEVNTIFVGNLNISDIRPDIDIGLVLRSMSINAEVDAELDVQMIETETGASLWNGSASATRRIGGLSVIERKFFTFDADDPDRAYGELVDVLVDYLSRDFRVRWVRQ